MATITQGVSETFFAGVYMLLLRRSFAIIVEIKGDRTTLLVCPLDGFANGHAFLLVVVDDFHHVIMGCLVCISTNVVMLYGFDNRVYKLPAINPLTMVNYVPDHPHCLYETSPRFQGGILGLFTTAYVKYRRHCERSVAIQ